MTTDMVQMNTRISRSLKERGDAALERAGYSPSQAVRKLWTTPRRTRTTRAPYKTCSTQKTKRRNEKLKRSARGGGKSRSGVRTSSPMRTSGTESSLPTGR